MESTLKIEKRPRRRAFPAIFTEITKHAALYTEPSVRSFLQFCWTYIIQQSSSTEMGLFEGLCTKIAPSGIIFIGQATKNFPRWKGPHWLRCPWPSIHDYWFDDLKIIVFPLKGLFLSTIKDTKKLRQNTENSDTRWDALSKLRGCDKRVHHVFAPSVSLRTFLLRTISPPTFSLPVHFRPLYIFTPYIFTP